MEPARSERSLDDRLTSVRNHTILRIIFATVLCALFATLAHGLAAEAGNEVLVARLRLAQHSCVALFAVAFLYGVFRMWRIERVLNVGRRSRQGLI